MLCPLRNVVSTFVELVALLQMRSVITVVVRLGPLLSEYNIMGLQLDISETSATLTTRGIFTHALLPPQIKST